MWPGILIVKYHISPFSLNSVKEIVTKTLKTVRLLNTEKRVCLSFLPVTRKVVRILLLFLWVVSGQETDQSLSAGKPAAEQCCSLHNQNFCFVFTPLLGNNSLYFYFFFLIDAGSHCVVQASLKLDLFLLQLPKCSDYKSELLCLAAFQSLGNISKLCRCVNTEYSHGCRHTVTFCWLFSYI